MCELWQMTTICYDLYWHLVNISNVNTRRGQDKRVEVNPLCGRCISRNFNNLRILKNTSLVLKCMVTFLTMFKENKTTGLSYKILVSLEQQLLICVWACIINVGKTIYRKQIDTTITIYWSPRSAEHVSDNIWSIFWSVRLRFLQHMV